MKYLSPLSILMLLFVLTSPGIRPVQGQIAADHILLNGKVLTVDENFSIAQAIAIQGERIAAVGTNDEIRRFIGPETIVTDLGGKTVIPGLIDNHVHYLRSSPTWRWEVLFDGVRTRARALTLLKEKVDSSQPGDWVMSVGGWTPNQFIDSQEQFTKEELDGIAPDNPVFIQFGFSGGVANSLALKLVGVSSRGGRIRSQRRYAGLPAVIREALPAYTAEGWKKEYLAKMNEDYNRGGITTIWNAGAIHYDNKFSEWSDEFVDDNGGWSNVRIFHHIKSDAMNPEAAAEVIKKITDWPEPEKGDYFRYQGFGEIPYMPVYDMMRREWNPDQTSMGIYKSILETVAEKRWQVSEHSMLKEKFDKVLPILEEINRHHNIIPLRWAFHHCYGITKEQLERAARLGMFAALQNSTVMTGGAVARYYPSESPPFRTAQESGIKWGLGTDAKIVSPYPAFLTLYFAVTGKDVAGNVVLRNETVTREQALIAHTRSNAWFLFMEDHLGSLEPGKYADLVVLDRDYMTVPEEEIREIESVLTIIGGRTGYEAKQ